MSANAGCGAVRWPIRIPAVWLCRDIRFLRHTSFGVRRLRLHGLVRFGQLPPLLLCERRQLVFELHVLAPVMSGNLVCM